jgi:dTMP kinase
MFRGPFIAFEGLDKTGKTSLCASVARDLCETEFIPRSISFPRRHTDTGYILDKYLKKEIELNDCVSYHLFSANRWEAHNEIIDILKTENPVLTDRYVASGIAYTAAKGNLSIEWCEQFNVGLPKPDLVVYLEGEVTNLQARPNYGRERYENPEFQISVKQIYDKLRDQDPSWMIVKIDGKTRQQMYTEVYPKILDLVENFPKTQHNLLYF